MTLVTTKNVKMVSHVLLISCIPVIAWIFRFHNFPIGNPEDWADFGSFYGGIIIAAPGQVTLFFVLRAYTNQKASEYQLIKRNNNFFMLGILK